MRPEASGAGASTAAGNGPLPTMSMPIQAPLDAALVTLGIVVVLPEPWGGELHEWRTHFGDALAAIMPPHITLLPPTSIAATRLKRVETHLETIAASTKPFTLSLRGTDSFRPISPVVFMKVEDGGEPCRAVQERVRSGPLARDLEFPFHPHVTVAQDLDEATLDDAEKSLATYRADFPVESMGLYEHDSDGSWQLRKALRFAGR